MASIKQIYKAGEAKKLGIGEMDHGCSGGGRTVDTTSDGKNQILSRS